MENFWVFWGHHASTKKGRKLLFLFWRKFLKFWKKNFEIFWTFVKKILKFWKFFWNFEVLKIFLKFWRSISLKFRRKRFEILKKHFFWNFKEIYRNFEIFFAENFWNFGIFFLNFEEIFLKIRKNFLEK